MPDAEQLQRLAVRDALRAIVTDATGRIQAMVGAEPLNATGVRKLGSLMASLADAEFKRHPNHPRSEPCIFRSRGTRKSADPKQLSMLRQYLAGEPPRRARDVKYSDQGFRDVVSGPVRFALREAFFKSALAEARIPPPPPRLDP